MLNKEVFVQRQVLLSLMERYQENGCVGLFERSISAARQVFIEDISPILLPEDYHFLCQLADHAINVYEKNLKKIYIRVSDQENIARLRIRNRESEVNLR